MLRRITELLVLGCNSNTVIALSRSPNPHGCMRRTLPQLGRRKIVRAIIVLSCSIVGASVSLAQTQTASWRWSESAYWQYAEEPLPNTAVGLALTRRALGRRWWDLHLELAALAIMGHERKLAVCSASGCDDRQIGPLGSATAQFILGMPSRHLYSLLGVGGYLSTWGTGSASGIGPRGGLADVGLGSRIARVKLEARFHAFGNTNYGSAGAISFRFGVVQ